jgi:hypothetical protein
MRFPITSEQCVHPETKATSVVYYLFGMRDSFTTSGPNIDPLVNGEYPQLTIDMNTAIHTIGFSTINVYLDASGTIFALDSSGNPISNRLIVQTSYTYPYIDLSGNPIDGQFTVTFDDGTYYTNNDTNNSMYWYSIGGPNPIIYQFT